MAVTAQNNEVLNCSRWACPVIECTTTYREIPMKYLAIPLLLLTTGCASIVNGTSQTLSVETRLKGASVAGASCKMVNDNGTWFVTTPGSVTVHRSGADLSVTCSKEGVDPGIGSIKSSTKGMAFGNILFGGPIGAGVDIANGSAFDYPPLIQIEMGETTVIAPPTPQAAIKPAAQ